MEKKLAADMDDDDDDEVKNELGVESDCITWACKECHCSFPM